MRFNGLTTWLEGEMFVIMEKIANDSKGINLLARSLLVNRIESCRVKLYGTPGPQLIAELERQYIHVSEFSKRLFESDKFEQLQTRRRKKLKKQVFEEVNLVCLRVSDLLFTDKNTIKQVYRKARSELGLDFCTLEAVAQFKLQHHAMRYLHIAVKHDGCIFNFYLRGNEMHSDVVSYAERYDPMDICAFCLNGKQ